VIAVKYYLFPMTEQEALKATNMGWRFIMNNESRLIEFEKLGEELNTYDKGTSSIVYNNKVYRIHKDYTDVSNSRRIWLGVPKHAGSEIID
jgi:hypothetical protein